MLSVLGYGTTKQYSDSCMNMETWLHSVTSEITLNSHVYGSKCKTMLQDFVVQSMWLISIQSSYSLLFTLYIPVICKL